VVDFADVVVPGLASHRNAADLAELSTHQFACGMRGGYGDIHHGLGHGGLSMSEKAAQHTRSEKSDQSSDSGSIETRLARMRVVLINTTHPGNIGATARAMKVMGLGQLHLVSPKIYPSADATARASGADDILEHALVHETLEPALSGCGLVLGTSARLRSLPMPLLDARAAAAQAVAEADGHEIAVLFGRERHGLTNEEMQRCNFLVNIPTNPEYGSLNIAQAVQIIAYELRLAAMAASGGEIGVVLPPTDWQPVDGAQMDMLFEHLEKTLLDLEFLNPKQPKKLMMRLRRLFNRARPDQNEMNILRGILRAAQEASKKR
jgi:TrmH family RNA methyltransferase